MKSRSLLIALAAFIGMVDALYLSIQRNAGPIPCHVTRGCTDVVTSRFSAVFGVPISSFGLAFYLVVFSLAVFSLFDTEQTGQWLRWVFWLSGIALVVSTILTGIQAFVLKAFCEYCLLSATLVLTIFLLSLGPVWRKRSQ